MIDNPTYEWQNPLWIVKFLQITIARFVAFDFSISSIFVQDSKHVIGSDKGEKSSVSYEMNNLYYNYRTLNPRTFCDSACARFVERKNCSLINACLPRNRTMNLICRSRNIDMINIIILCGARIEKYWNARECVDQIVVRAQDTYTYA